MSAQSQAVGAFEEQEAYRATLALLSTRVLGATICPSEVARAVVDRAQVQGSSDDWRGAMPMVHAAVDRLLAEGAVQLSWRGRRLEARTGPYRIGRLPTEPKQNVPVT